jgi:hypothetical protein
LPAIEQLRERWDSEWAVLDAWLPTVTDRFVAYVHEGLPVWQMLVINYAEEQAAGGSTKT